MALEDQAEQLARLSNTEGVIINGVSNYKPKNSNNNKKF